MAKYSLIIPAYNEEKTIEKTILSLKNQTFKDKEIIVVDNNSKDNTGKIARRLVKQVFLEKKQGYIHAVNRGIKESCGKYLAVCDADSTYPRDWLEKIDREFKKGYSVVYGSAKVNDSNFLVNSTAKLFFDIFLIVSKLLGVENTSGFNFVYTREVYEKAGGYDPKYLKASPDVMLGNKMKKFGKIKLNTNIYVYSSTRRFQKKGFLATLLMFAKLWWAVVKGKEPNLDYKKYNS